MERASLISTHMLLIFGTVVTPGLCILFQCETVL